METSFDLRQDLKLYRLYLRILELTAIVLQPEALNDLEKAIIENDVARFKFAPTDIKQFLPSIKHMNLVDIADGTSLFYAALKETGGDQARLLAVSLQKFQVFLHITLIILIIFPISLLHSSIGQAAARKMWFDPEILITLGNMLLGLAKQFDKMNDSEAKAQMLKNAKDAFYTAFSIAPRDARYTTTRNNPGY